MRFNISKTWIMEKSKLEDGQNIEAGNHLPAPRTPSKNAMRIADRIRAINRSELPYKADELTAVEIDAHVAIAVAEKDAILDKMDVKRAQSEANYVHLKKEFDYIKGELASLRTEHRRWVDQFGLEKSDCASDRFEDALQWKSQLLLKAKQMETQLAASHALAATLREKMKLAAPYLRGSMNDKQIDSFCEAIDLRESDFTEKINLCPTTKP